MGALGRAISATVICIWRATPPLNPACSRSALIGMVWSDMDPGGRCAETTGIGEKVPREGLHRTEQEIVRGTVSFLLSSGSKAGLAGVPSGWV